jgi:hypothetical protein
LIPAAARWQGSASALCHAFLRRVACIDVAPAAYVPGLVEHAEVVARGTTAAGRGHRLVALREWSGTGSDVQGHHAHTAGGGAAVRRLRLAHRGQRGGSAGWKPCVVGSGGMPHAMPEVNPRMRRRWRPPTALTWHVLNRVLCHLRPQAPPCVRPRRPGTLVIRPGTSAGTGVASTGAVLPRGRARACNMWQPRGQCWLSSPRQRPYTPGTLGHLVIPWQSHLNKHFSGVSVCLESVKMTTGRLPRPAYHLASYLVSPYRVAGYLVRVSSLLSIHLFLTD